MDNNDDESSLSPTPNDFLLSTYKGNPLANINQTTMKEESFKIVFAYQCALCLRIHTNPIITCASCVNAGNFCSSKHKRCSKAQREILFHMLNKNDCEEFEDYPTKTSMHVPCSHQMLLLEKYQSEKAILQSEYERKMTSVMKVRQMLDEIQLRKSRLPATRHSIEKLQQQIEQRRRMNMSLQGRIDQIRMSISHTRIKIPKIRRFLRLSQSEIKKMIDYRIQEENVLHNIRRDRLNELMTYIFPIRRIAASEDALAKRIKALKRAQETIADDDDDGGKEMIEVETPDELVTLKDRYQLVNSFLPTNGDYQIVNLVAIYNSDLSRDSDSPQLSPSCESHDTLAALSHACQVVNIMAFYLDIKLPFHLHHWEFNKEELIVDDLRADIAKLNANIISSCLAQGIPIEFTNVSCTLENLLRLLTMEQCSSRPKAITYPQSYIDILETEVINVHRALTTSYWFDSYMSNDEEDVTKLLNSGEYDVVEGDEYPSDETMTIREHSDSSPSTSATASTPPQPSVMSSSLDYIKHRSSDLISSFFRSSRS